MESSAACPLHVVLEMVRPLSDPYGSVSRYCDVGVAIICLVQVTRHLINILIGEVMRTQLRVRTMKHLNDP